MSNLNKEKYTYEKLFYEALRIRKIEKKIIEIYSTDKIQSPVHLSIGQEHHIVSLCACISHHDKAFTTYRSHALYLAKGGDLKSMFAELYGKIDGISKGKAGSMHLCSQQNNLFGSSAIVGSVFSHAMGMAYVEKFNKTSNITICVTGDGATEEGTFHECLNFSSLKQLPILYVIENNGLAIHIPISTRQNYDLKKLVNAYNIKYANIDGFDLEGGYLLFEDIVRFMRKNPQPVVIEVDTYRYMQHVGVQMDYDQGYRKLSDYENWKKRDPLINQIELIDHFSPIIDNEIHEAILFAEQSPYPAKSELLKDVY